jgi:hypothetical protein
VADKSTVLHPYHAVMSSDRSRIILLFGYVLTVGSREGSDSADSAFVLLIRASLTSQIGRHSICSVPCLAFQPAWCNS